MAHTNPEQSKRSGPVAPQRYGDPSRWSIAAISCDSNLRKPELEGAVEGERSMVGLGLASHVGLESETTAAAIIAKSSGEHATSFTSLLWPVTRGRVWANDAVDKTTRAKQANKARGNSFRNSIDRELPFSSVIFNFGIAA